MHSSILAWRIPIDRGARRAAGYEHMKCYFSLKGWQTNYDYSDLEICPHFLKNERLWAWQGKNCDIQGKNWQILLPICSTKEKKRKNRTLENWYLAEMAGCFWYCMMKCVSIWKISKLGEPIFSKWPVHSVTKPGMWVKKFIQIVRLKFFFNYIVFIEVNFTEHKNAPF